MSEDVVKVFISYSWDSEEHKDKVLILSDSLRRYGIDCHIDRYHQSPSGGWYRWMMDQIEEADFVLVICTEKYNLRFRNKEEQGQGQGVTWEGGLIIAELYSGQGINDKFIPVLLSPEAEDHIPRSLQTNTVYRLWNDDYDINRQGEYQDLYRHLTKQPAYVPAELGEIQKLLPVNKAPSIVGGYGEIIQADDPTISIHELVSERGVDYTRLRNLLRARRWKEADQETAARMGEAMGQRDWLRVDDVQYFPCTDLRTIDQLWVQHSEGKFGFSVQKRIWHYCGRPTERNRQWEEFGEVVGWKKRFFLGINSDWKLLSEVTFDISAPFGHLPVRAFRSSLDIYDEESWSLGEIDEFYFFCLVPSRLEDCKVP